MRVKEIHVGKSGVIPVASYENLRPSFDMTIEISKGESYKKVFNEANRFIQNLFDMEANRARIDLIEKQYHNIRFREKDGRKYPSVTSITDWDKDWKITDDELRQYGARGNIIHKLIEIYINTKKWVEPERVPELKEDLIVLVTGSLNLSWKDCSYKKFFKQFGKDFEWLEGEQVIFNDEHLYSGRYDRKCRYKGRLSMLDFKTGAFHMKQLAAYAVCEKGIEQLIVCPVGKTDNICGYKKPSITEAIQDNFKSFLKDRTKFRERFGV
jgi:hypothetical protein